MNKTAIRNFSVKARRKLIEEITHKAYEIGITKDKILDIETFEGGFRVKGRENGQTFKKYELEQRDKLIHNIKYKGFEQVIEEVAYTWFNRFIALRFMEINNYLPTGVRVLSSVEEGKVEPDIIKEALNIDLDVDRETIFRLQDSNDTEDLYKYLLVRQCNQLGKIMPAVFEKIADYTELLLPDKLLIEGSVIRDLVEEIEEYDWKIELSEEEQKQEEEKGEHGIEIIGWLYQYYISEKKDEVFAGLKKNKKITKENIPAATQLFTPKWIVKYMVENSLGRLWLESHPNEELKSGWKYYLEEAEQEPEVQKQLDELKNPDLNPEEIKVLDPAMGSGHILVYAFDVLYEIYLSLGYSERDIPTLILEKNLYGLDIDDRAGQLASFALLMKARGKDRRIFRSKPKTNLCAIQESNDISKEAIEYFCKGGLGSPEIKKDIEYLIKVFHDAKEYGSILEVKEIDFDALGTRVEEIRNSAPEDIFELQYKDAILEKIPPLIGQARIMSRKHDVVCTNPPYMGIRNINPKLAEYLINKFPFSKNDIFSVFIEKGFNSIKKHGYNAMVTMQSWMFLPSFEQLRKMIINNKYIISLIHMGNNVMGIAFGTTAMVFRNTRTNYIGTYNYVRLMDLDKDNSPVQFPLRNNRFRKTNISVYKKIPGYSICYWISETMKAIFIGNNNLDEIAKPRQGMATSDNDRFLRMWGEVNIYDIGFNKKTNEDAKNSELKWFPYNKGGQYRKWYGNNDIVINWENDGSEIKEFATKKYNNFSRTIKNMQFYFKKSITWTLLSSSGLFGVRYIPEGFIFDVNGMSLFATDSKLFYLLGLMNSRVVIELLKVINSTMAFQVGDIKKIPIIMNSKYIREIRMLCENSIDISKIDWDSFETSWDFRIHPFLKHLDLGENHRLPCIFTIWETETEEAFNQLKANEEELNRIFIEIYGLQDELTPEVADEDITINKADRERDIKSFISYAVGCMFGRYSLDEDGLIYAGGDFDDKFRIRSDEWEIKTKEGWKKSSINIAEHNVIPIAGGDYFEDDILDRFVEFVKISFGAKTLEENLEYIAETLGQRTNETSRQAIRRYFLKDFYKDHVKIYKKRPIYWLFDSGRQNGFKALIYMHRYNPYTVARVRTDYLHSLQKKYEAEINHLDILIDSEISNREKTVARKNKETVLKQIQECRSYDEAIAHVANQKVEIDLDDGVKVNYAKFQGIEIPQGEGKRPLKADLLAKI